ncbi:MAG: acetate--CoA ligase family protein, partial [bacterium]|nr:acetate--CoA ligase family protein [bacterium]
MDELSAEAAERGWLSERDAKRLLSAFGISVPSSGVAASPLEVEAAVSELTPPFAVKVMSQDILHKSDIGGVRINLPDGAAACATIEAMAATPAIRDARVDGYLIEEMAPAGLEVVIGTVRDMQFGPMIMVGLGGVFVEVLADVAFRICPIGEADARAML